MDESSTKAHESGEPSPGSDSEILGRFLNDLGQAADRGVAIAWYCENYPGLADKIRELVEMEQMMAGSPPGADGDGDATAPPWLGPYHVRRLIGRGGMGEVFEAVEEPLNRRVAVKTLRRGRNTRPDLMERFLRERKVLARLHHTNIVPIYAAGQEGSLLYFAMPYIEGAPLDKVVETARSHGSSEPAHSTPTLAGLAEEARSRSTESAETAVVPPPRVTAEDLSRTNVRPAALSLSMRYLRSVAEAVAEVAEAVHHAHQVDIIHRDLKPSNLMIDTKGHCWVLDFGLARVKAGLSEDGPLRDLTEPKSASLTSGVALGTPPYMAPEQHERGGTITPRTDVWGLGVTLYELLTLRRAFPSSQQILDPDHVPDRPTALVRNVPRDLEAVCQKAMRRDPEHRYQTALELADDLRHWLNHEPTRARPARTARRLALWARRNRGWAAAILFAGVLLATLGFGGVVYGYMKAQAERNQRRETLISDLQQLRLTSHREGWSAEANDLIRQAAAIRRGPVLQAQAAASLIGVDATLRKTLNIPCLSLAFDPSGKELFLVGEDGRTRAWDSTLDQVRDVDHVGRGIIAFRHDGTPVQLDYPGPGDEKNSVSLWDLNRKALIGRFKVPADGASEVKSLAITPGATYVAASAARPDGKGTLAVWEAGSGRLLRKLATDRATEVAISPDGGLVAFGTEDGQIHVWPLPDGDQVASLRTGPSLVNCLAFDRDRMRVGGQESRLSPWILASGDNGGTVIVWDLHSKTPRSYCRGSRYVIYSLAFSPDGMTLASGGRNGPKLWDVATGRLLLDLAPQAHIRDYIVAASFSPDGSKLALGVKGMIDVVELANGRGIKTLRGLQAMPEKATFSTDGQLVAGLAQDWRAGVWDTTRVQLLHVFEGPTGNFADNAGMAFDPEKRRFAVSAGHEARMWDLATGKLLNSWSFPEGFQDTLAFHGSDQLLLFRVETKDGKALPYGQQSHPRDHPRVCRIRDLLSNQPTTPLREILDFNWQVHHTVVAPNGDCFVSEGVGGSKGERRMVMAFDGPTGKALWTKESGLRRDSISGLRVDPSGRMIGVNLDHSGRTSIFSMPSGQLLRVLDEGVDQLSPGAKGWTAGDADHSTGAPTRFAVHQNESRLCAFSIDNDRGSTIRFSPDDRHLSWGDASGQVYLADLVEVQRRLAAVGLGW